LLLALENVEEQLHLGVRSVAVKGQRPHRAEGPEAAPAKVMPGVHIGQTPADSSTLKHHNTVKHHRFQDRLEAQVLNG